MIIGVPREIKNNEYRVSLTPPGARELARAGHTVVVQSQAGTGSGFTDEQYTQAGARLEQDAATVFESADMVLKVKEPVPDEYELIRAGQVLFTFFHFASSRELTHAMVARGAICIAYETVEDARGGLPLLKPMSEVAGRLAVHAGAHYLEKPRGGPGILPGGVPGVLPAKALILGGGIVGTQAARVAAGFGMDVTILDVDLDRLRYLADIMPPNVKTLMSNEFNIRAAIRDHHLIVGAVLIHGARSPHLITRDMLRDMLPGTVIVDVDVDQGGCVETSRPTTHEEPTYTVDDVLHYCVSNMPGAVPLTSTLALTNATFPYVRQVANFGWQEACRRDPGLRRGLNVVRGEVVYAPVAEAVGLPVAQLDRLLER